MASITSTGVGSGLDVNNIVGSLMALEKRPLTLLQGRASLIQSKLSAFGTLKSQIAGLGDLATRLADPASWNPLRSDSSDAASVSATATSGARAGRYSLEVQQLAQAQALVSRSYSAATAAVGTGSLTLERGTTVAGVFTPDAASVATVIAIAVGSQTLAGVRDAINAASAGVTASIVTSAGSSQLMLLGADGAKSSIRLSVSDDDGNGTYAAGLSALAWDPAAAVGGGKNLSQARAAQDAQFTLNGLALASASNAPTGVIEGLSLNLKRVTTAPVVLTVSLETMAVRKNVNDFVASYNALNKLLQSQTQADPSGVNRGPLQADSTALPLLSSLRELLRGAVSGLGGASGMNSAGLELQRDGSLLVKDARLAPLLETPAALARLFSQPQVGSDLDSRGFAVRFKQWSADLTGSTGTLAGRTEGLERSVSANRREQSTQQDKLTRTEARLRAQYQRLDGDMSRLNAQLGQLTSSLGLDRGRS